MTYATITTTQEVLETVEESRQNRDYQLPTFYSFLNKLGKFDKPKKTR